MTTTTTYLVDGITCSHCSDTVTAELTALESVTGVVVELQTGNLATVTVESATALDYAVVAGAVRDAGYVLVDSALGISVAHVERLQSGDSMSIQPPPPKPDDSTFACPMHPEIVDDHASDCPKCGMHLVPATSSPPHGNHHESTEAHAASQSTAPRSVTGVAATQYTCPMHPEVVRDTPGRCPICGMHLEAVMPSGEDESALREYRNMRRRFWISVPLSLLTLSLAMLDFPPVPDGWGPWVQFALATPVVLWCAGPFLKWAV
ncbi:MAG: heavy metal-binding domain-containing protein, partial [bacterium]|nr:heavy metal-binding domain-containing protein [bacterium]